MRLALSLSLVVAGCTVGPSADEPTPTVRDGGDFATPSAPDGRCALPLDRALGPYADRISCPMPLSLPPGGTDSARAAIAALEAMSVALCEEDRARVSWLEPDEWQLEREASWRVRPGVLGVHIGSRGVERLWPTPRERWVGCTIEERALEWMEAHRAIFLIADDDVELSVASSSEDEVVLAQAWRGVRVLWTRVELHWDERLSRFSEVSGWILFASQMPETAVPAIDRAEALRRVAPVSAPPTLVVWPEPVGRARLVWVVHEEGSRERFVIDAMSGDVVKTHCDATTLCGI